MAGEAGGVVSIESHERTWESYFQEGPPQGADRHFIIRSLFPLVRAVARSLKATLPSWVDIDELVSAGVVGLISAVDRFDPSKGSRFKSYATIRIKGSMLDELRQLDWAPRTVRDDEGHVEQARKELEEQLGRRPTQEEMAGKLGLSGEGYHRLIRRIAPQRVIGFDDLGIKEERSESSAFNFIEDPSSPDPSEENVMKDALEVLGEGIEKLKERQRQMIKLYYYENLNLKEIAAIFGVTESRVSQIHSEAVRVLKSRLSSRMR